MSSVESSSSGFFALIPGQTRSLKFNTTNTDTGVAYDEHYSELNESEKLHSSLSSDMDPELERRKRRLQNHHDKFASQRFNFLRSDWELLKLHDVRTLYKSQGKELMGTGAWIVDDAGGPSSIRSYSEPHMDLRSSPEPSTVLRSSPEPSAALQHQKYSNDSFLQYVLGKAPDYHFDESDFAAPIWLKKTMSAGKPEDGLDLESETTEVKALYTEIKEFQKWMHDSPYNDVQAEAMYEFLERKAARFLDGKEDSEPLEDDRKDERLLKLVGTLDDFKLRWDQSLERGKVVDAISKIWHLQEKFDETGPRYSFLLNLQRNRDGWGRILLDVHDIVNNEKKELDPEHDSRHGEALKLVEETFQSWAKGHEAYVEFRNRIWELIAWVHELKKGGEQKYLESNKTAEEAQKELEDSKEQLKKQWDGSFEDGAQWWWLKNAALTNSEVFLDNLSKRKLFQEIWEHYESRVNSRRKFWLEQHALGLRLSGIRFSRQALELRDPFEPASVGSTADKSSEAPSLSGEDPSTSVGYPASSTDEYPNTSGESASG